MLLAAGREVVSKTSAYNITKLSYRVEARVPNNKNETQQNIRANIIITSHHQNGQLNILMRRTRNIYHLQIRKMKRIQHRIKRNTLLNACLNNNGDLFKEIKKQRKCKKTIATSIDGHQDNIPIYFAKKYKTLYNSVDDKTNLARIALRTWREKLTRIV